MPSGSGLQDFLASTALLQTGVPYDSCIYGACFAPLCSDVAAALAKGFFIMPRFWAAHRQL